MCRANELYKFILENLGIKVVLKVLFRIPSIWANFGSFQYPFHFFFFGNFTRQTIINSCIRTDIDITWIITLGEEVTKSTMRNFQESQFMKESS